MELMEVEVFINGQDEWFSSTILLEDRKHWYPAAVRWITNLCGSLSDTVYTPTGSVYCRRKDTAIFDPISSTLRNTDYVPFGVIRESEWAVGD